ncbi:hypothetical protein CICLE_v10015993mg [Citrus x clementina]|uniref:Uncharacterized protein n=3 Tax=Citrus TaxID=2706 RepID=V4U5G3_CITCL|nr:xanthohumol 4'-O-methyltransferase [Citrus x clementina]XP_015382862.1 xanthohumol 4-O-methyltransferase-like [Citrus sinensis]ESR61132.1 hypothetical protein CICLE_v10015993mg [Citrus x clementina]BDS00350.1 O-methyl transferase [Citrus reticulata]GAY56193.1 hypothetical protein CUMW_169990 [Citrus unshiu]
MHCHGSPITLPQLASGINSSCPDVHIIPSLTRIMRMLVRKGVFAAHRSSDGSEETMYGLTQISKWLLRDSEMSLAPMILFQNSQLLQAPWHHLSQCVQEGGNAFKKAHGCEMWDFASQNSQFNNSFNKAMACTAKIVMSTLLSHYKDGFDGIRSLVDVGGGTGEELAEIVEFYPHIKGVNFDLPHVVATAPVYEGVSHVGGDMLNAVPNADAVFMKWILHDWDDEACVRILKNCRKAIPEKTGKLVLVEIVVKEDDNDVFGDTAYLFDLCMFAHTRCGKERTEKEWKQILEEGGFLRHNIINLPAVPAIIEAYPQ